MVVVIVDGLRTSCREFKTHKTAKGAIEKNQWCTWTEFGIIIINVAFITSSGNLKPILLPQVHGSRGSEVKLQGTEDNNVIATQAFAKLKLMCSLEDHLRLYQLR